MQLQSLAYHFLLYFSCALQWPGQRTWPVLFPAFNQRPGFSFWISHVFLTDKATPGHLRGTFKAAVSVDLVSPHSNNCEVACPSAFRSGEINPSIVMRAWGKSYPCTRLWSPRGLSDVRASTFTRESTYRWQ